MNTKKEVRGSLWLELENDRVLLRGEYRKIELLWVPEREGKRFVTSHNDIAWDELLRIAPMLYGEAAAGDVPKDIADFLRAAFERAGDPFKREELINECLRRL
jgi:hypothetical protein